LLHRLDRLFQHELALLLHKRLCLVGQHREQLGELHLKPDVVLGDIHNPCSALTEHACVKIQVVARPLVFEIRDQLGRKMAFSATCQCAQAKSFSKQPEDDIL
jgi:hypothetical protein